MKRTAKIALLVLFAAGVAAGEIIMFEHLARVSPELDAGGLLFRSEPSQPPLVPR